MQNNLFHIGLKKLKLCSFTSYGVITFSLVEDNFYNAVQRTFPGVLWGPHA